MAVTKTDVFNEVLANLREPSITSWDDSAAIPRKIALLYRQGVEFALAMHPWNHSSWTETLQVDGAEEHIGYDYVYAKPEGWLRTNWVSPTVRREDALRTEWEDQGGFILSSWNPLYMGFVHNRYVDEPGRWGPAFATFVAALLARMVSRPVAGQRADWSDMNDLERGLLEEAKLQDAMNSPAPPRRMGRINQARYGSAWRGLRDG